MDEQERIELLAKYLGVDPEEVENNGGQEYGTKEESYLVVDEDEARDLAEDYIKDFIDEFGIGGFTEDFQEWIKANALDEDWFADVQKEDYAAYVDDIEGEGDDTYANRLVQEMVSDGVLDNDDLYKNEDGLLDIKDGIDLDSKREEFLDRLCDGYDDKVEWYRDSFGDEDLTATIKAYPYLLDTDKIVDEAIDWDGIAHFIASYDGEEIDLGDGMFAYRVN